MLTTDMIPSGPFAKVVQYERHVRQQVHFAIPRG